MSLAANAASIIAPVILYSPSAQTITSLAYNTAGLVVSIRKGNDASYTKYGPLNTALVTATAGAYTSGGFILVGNATGTTPTVEIGIPSSFVSSGVAIEVKVFLNAELIGAWRDIPNLAAVDSSGRTDVSKIAGATQTARDIGASVLLSPGTGTGQLSLSSGTVIAGSISANAISASAIASSALTSAKFATGVLPSTALDPEVVGRYLVYVDALSAAAIASITTAVPTASANASAVRTNLTSELATILLTYSRIGTPAGASIAADIAGIAGSSGVGNGDQAVDHNYGTTDAYRIVSSVDGSPVDDAVIAAFVGSTATGTPDAQTRTGSDGRWIAPLMLDAGTYTLVFSKAGVIESSSISLTVT